MTDVTRQHFEEYAEQYGFDISRDMNYPHCYADDDTELAWTAWEARGINDDACCIRRWQPIQTAPKNGQWILAVVAGSLPSIVSWAMDGNYWRVSEPNPDINYESWKPTHWMPILTPPT